MRELKCAITGKVCTKSGENTKPCNICKIGSEWLNENDNLILHDEK